MLNQALYLHQPMKIHHYHQMNQHQQHLRLPLPQYLRMGARLMQEKWVSFTFIYVFVGVFFYVVVLRIFMRVLHVKSVRHTVAEYGQVQVAMHLCALHNQQCKKALCTGDRITQPAVQKGFVQRGSIGWCVRNACLTVHREYL
jgi:hypothetical protein